MSSASRMPSTAAMISRQRVFIAPSVGSRAYMAVPISRLVGLEVIERMRTAIRQRPVISMARIKTVVNVSVKSVRPMEPGTCSNENSTYEPVGPIVAIRSTIIGSVIEIPVGAHRGDADVDGNLCRRNWRPADHGGRKNRESKRFHRSEA